VSLWRCPSCRTLYNPDPGICPLCDRATVLTQHPTFTIHGYRMPPLPYHGPDRRRPRLGMLAYVQFALALLGLAALVGGHVETLIAHFSLRELWSVSGGISAIVFALLTDPRIFAQLRSIQSVLDPEDPNREAQSDE
jgi:hypothetical protein